jgi:predicted RNA-binding protein with PIN domain
MKNPGFDSRGDHDGGKMKKTNSLWLNDGASMPYLIDGHNLIPKIHGLSLSEIDDEERLIKLLQEFGYRRRKQIEVFFDNSPSSQPRLGRFGFVTARFVRQGTTADQAIEQRLKRLGREAHNWTVVSSDQAVQASARFSHAHFIASETFAQELEQTLQESNEPPIDQDIHLDEGEIDDWLELFGGEEPES